MKFRGENMNQKKILVIIAHDAFQDKEYQVLEKIFKEKGHQMVVASSNLTEARGLLGLRVKPDVILSEVHPEDYDAFVFIGGPGSEEYFYSPSSLHLVRRAFEIKKTIGAISITPVILANSGILAGKRATVASKERQFLDDAGAFYTGRILEEEGHIITAASPEASEMFGQAVIKDLG